MRYKITCITCLISAFISLSQYANAQNKPDSLQEKLHKDFVLNLDEVVVVSRAVQKEVIPVQILSGVQLKALSVYSIADAVRYFSGVQIKDYGGIGGLKTVNVRSMGSHHVGVFYDGIQVSNAQNGVIDLGRFSLDNMESVSMYNGQKSNIFQPAKDFASASSIYMRTRTPYFDDDKKYNLNIGLKGGSFATINPSILWEQRISDKVSSSVSAEYMYTSGEYKFNYAKINGYDTTEIRKNGDVRTSRVEGALFGRIDDGDWRAKVYFYDSERGYPGASVRSQPGKFEHEDRQWDTNIFVQGSFRKNIGSFYSLLLNGKYAYDYLHYLSDPNLNSATMYVNNKYKQQEVYFSVANRFTIFDWWDASFSTDLQYNTLDADLERFVYPQRYTILNSIATSIDLKRFKFQTSLLHTYVNDKIEYVGGSEGDTSIFTPTAVVSYKPFSDIGLNFRAFYKRIFRMPTFNDLYYTYIGSTNLKPEYTNQYNVGVTYANNYKNAFFSRFEVQVDTYFNQIENMIIAVPGNSQFRWMMLSIGYVEIRGVDVALQGDWSVGSVGFNTRFNYTYQKAQNFSFPDKNYYGDQVPYIPLHNASVVLGADYRGWSMNYSFLYTGERYEAEANIIENYVQPWYTHDLSLTKSIEFKKLELRLTAEVNNIFNQQYEVVQCYPMPGTNFKIKINIII